MDRAMGQESTNKAYEVVTLKSVALVGKLLSEYFNPMYSDISLGTTQAFPAYIHLGDCYTNTPPPTHTPQVPTHNDPENWRILKLKGNQVTCVTLQKNYLLTCLKL